MDKTNDFAELQELKAKYDLLNEKLEQQTIINEKLISESMKQKLSYVDRTGRMYRYAGIIVAPLLIVLLVLYKASLSMWIIVGVTMIVEMLLYRREYSKLDTKSLMTLGHVDAVERVATFRKNFKRISYVMLIPSLVIFILFVGMVTDYKFEIGTVIYYAIFVVVVSIYETVRSKKMFKNLEAVLKQIEELRSE